MSTSEVMLPRIAILGAGIFVRTQYIPRLKEIADLVIVKAIWSRSEESAKTAVELVRDFSPDVECKWGDLGLSDIIQDASIQGVAVVLAGQIQVDISLKMLRAGKHVIQEKPASGSTSDAEVALSVYKSLCNSIPCQPIWAVAENYRFEPAFVESRKLINDIGDMMNIQVIVEGSMNSSNPYFSSSWRRNFTKMLKPEEFESITDSHIRTQKVIDGSIQHVVVNMTNWTTADTKYVHANQIEVERRRLLAGT